MPPPTNRALIAGREAALPESLQSPALELTAPEMRRAAYVFEQSLRFLADYFPQTRVYAVYVPSPLSCYELASPTVSIERYHGRAPVYDSKSVSRHSDHIAKLIGWACARAQVPFIDARPAMRAEARRRLIHGPRDWFHPNAIGYAALGKAILAGLR